MLLMSICLAPVPYCITSYVSLCIMYLCAFIGYVVLRTYDYDHAPAYVYVFVLAYAYAYAYVTP